MTSATTPLPGPGGIAGSPYTPEQAAAIERRTGDLLLDAGAGSGKTTVLVERYVRSVIDDGLAPERILAITFTEKAAAELRERIRRRLWESGAVVAARAADGAAISTIHGFCARLLRSHALAAGLDPGFSVLDELGARRLGVRAMERALAALADSGPGGREAIAAYGADPLREAIIRLYGELRARGQRTPTLPVIPPPPVLDPLRTELHAAAAALAAELGAIDGPPARVRDALARVEGCEAVLAEAEPWPAALARLTLPRNGGAALDTPAGERYAAAIEALRDGCAHRRAVGVREALQALLTGFGVEFEREKRARGRLDFEDLELRAAELVARNAAVRDGLRERFARVMVDELQDTNAVQLRLVESIGEGRLFTVGDAQQAIYGFRHAEVELFEALGDRRATSGERLSLATNFRTRPELIGILNRTFASLLGERFRPLRPGRPARDPPPAEPAVELLAADKDGGFTGDGLAAGWRLAEARALADRVRELVDGGARPREIVVLTRATTDLRAYERALEAAGVPTYLIGGRGYWSHPQVIDVVALLRSLANPCDEAALLSVLASPAVGMTLDGIVILAAAGRPGATGPMAEPPAGLSAEDRERLVRFTRWFGELRAEMPHLGVAELTERAICAGDYDLAVLRMPGGRRRMANIRKLLRLAREFEAESGPDLRGFLDGAAGTAAAELGGGGDPRESEAPVEGEALDAVRLMTIHRAKGLEFEIVCVADLGRGPVRSSPLVRVGSDGRLGVLLAQPGGGGREPALAYTVLGEHARQRADEEERRLFYVALTRARERLILSGAARFGAWERSSGPLSWLGPALCPEVASLLAAGGGVGQGGVRVTPVCEVPVPPPRTAAGPPAPLPPPLSPAGPAPPEPPSGPAAIVSRPPPPPPTLSYTSLSELRRCGYRFYLERVLGLPPVGEADASDAGRRGTLVHRALERLDFRRPVPPPARTLPGAATLPGRELDVIDAMLAAFAASPLCRRLGAGPRPAREQRFAFGLGPLMLTGVFDVLAEVRPGELLVVDYKSDRLDGEDPEAAVRRAYGLQRTIYGLAALRAGARRVEVVHAFLAAVDRPASAVYLAVDRPRLERELATVCAPVHGGEYRVTDAPERRVCHGCPGEGTLCSWPPAMTRRTASDQLF